MARSRKITCELLNWIKKKVFSGLLLAWKQEAKEYYEKSLSSFKEISNRAGIRQRLAQVLSY